MLGGELFAFCHITLVTYIKNIQRSCSMESKMQALIHVQLHAKEFPKTDRLELMHEDERCCNFLWSRFVDRNIGI